MAKRWNESYSMVRPEPFAHRIAYDASYNAEYEGWAEVSTVEGAAAWMVCKHSYDSNNNIYKQYNLYEIRGQFNDLLYEVRQDRGSNIDFSKNFTNITG